MIIRGGVVRRRLRRRTTWVYPVTAVLIVSVVLSSVGLGLRLPGLGVLAGFGDRGLDYRGIGGEALAELSAAFVNAELGTLTDVATAAAAGGTGASAGTGTQGPGTAPADGVGGLVIDDGQQSEDNDDFSQARTVNAIPFRNTPPRELSREPGEPSDCAGSEGTAWYRMTLSRDLPIVARTAVGGPAAGIAVYSGKNFDSLERIGCDVDARGNPLVRFNAEAGTTYFIQLIRTLSGAPPSLVITTPGNLLVGSRATDGSVPSGPVLSPMISGDGRWLTWISAADNIVPDHNNQCIGKRRAADPPSSCTHVYLTDLRTKRTVRVSSAPDGLPGNNDSYGSTLTTDGSKVAYTSFASNLVPGDSNATLDVFVWDRATGRTERVSLSEDNQETHPRIPVVEAGLAMISGNGGHVAFESDADDVVDGVTCPPTSYYDTTGCQDVYVRDLKARTTVLASRGSRNQRLTGRTDLGGITPDGRLVTFSVSDGAGAVPGDTNAQRDVFIRDLRRGVIELISATPSGTVGNNRSETSFGASLSADGRYVTFYGEATDLTGETDDNDRGDVFVRDRLTRTTTMVSVSSAGEQGTFDASGLGIPVFYRISITADGRYVTFPSALDGLTADDTNELVDVFRRDLRFKTTTRISQLESGSEGVVNSGGGSISDDGRWSTFLGTGLTGNTKESQAAGARVEGGDPLLERGVGVTPSATTAAGAPSSARGSRATPRSTRPPTSGTRAVSSRDAVRRLMPFLRHASRNRSSWEHSDVITRGGVVLRRLRHRSTWVYPVTAVLVVSVVLSSVGLGLRLPGLGLLAGFGDRGLDYRTVAGDAFTELSPAFLDAELGPLASAAAARAADAAARAAGIEGLAPGSLAADGGRALVIDDGRQSANNDNFDEARTVNAIPFRNTPPQELSREPGEPRDCASSEGTAWYRMTLSRDLPIVARTTVGGPPAGIAVYSGTGYGSLNRIGCDVDTAGSPLVAFSAQAGMTYFIQLIRTVSGRPPSLVVTTPGNLLVGSRATNGSVPSGPVMSPMLSADGRWLTWVSAADNLAPDHNNQCVSQRRATDLPASCTHVYLTDLRTKRTVRVSSAPGGLPGNSDSYGPTLTGDGSKVAFSSFASNLVAGDSNGTVDAFVWDRATGRTERVSLSEANQETHARVPVIEAGLAMISRDGSHVAFESDASDVVDGVGCPPTSYYVDDQRCGSVYVRNLKTRKTVLASRGSRGQPLPGIANLGSLSADGTMITFGAYDFSETVPGDTNGQRDVFFRDLRRGVTELVSATPEGGVGNNRSETSLVPPCRPTGDT